MITTIQEFLFEIYGPNNRLYTIEKIACILQRLKSYMAKDPSIDNVRKKALWAFAWTCGTGNLFGVDIRQNLYKHFPGICPYCKKTVCDGTKHERMKVADVQTNMSFAELAEMLAGIYPNNTLDKSIEKFGEEISEMPFAYYDSATKFLEELSDVTARLMSVIYLAGIHRTFEKDLFEKFKNGCSGPCGKKVCKCHHFLEPPIVESTPSIVE